MLEDLKQVAEWIRGAHDPKAIATAAGLCFKTVQVIGSGEHTPSVRTLEKLLKVKATPAPRAPQPPPAW